MKVIFFDGYCGLCNGFVDFIMRVDKKNVFTFSPLQSDYAKTQLRREDYENLDSVVVLIDGQAYRKAPAVFRALRELNIGWKMISLVGLLPSSILNFGYDLVAKYRYRILGKRETCRLPSPEERQKFLL